MQRMTRPLFQAALAVAILLTAAGSSSAQRATGQSLFSIPATYQHFVPFSGEVAPNPYCDNDGLTISQARGSNPMQIGTLYANQEQTANVLGDPECHGTYKVAWNLGGHYSRLTATFGLDPYSKMVRSRDAALVLAVQFTGTSEVIWPFTYTKTLKVVHLAWNTAPIALNLPLRGVQTLTMQVTVTQHKVTSFAFTKNYDTNAASLDLKNAVLAR